MKVVSLYLPSDINGMPAKYSNEYNTSVSTGAACHHAGFASIRGEEKKSIHSEVVPRLAG